MSRFSGKFDLYDDIGGLGGWFDKDGKPTSMSESKGVLYSDEYLDFVTFKKQTNGTLYQHHKIKVNENNIEFVKQHCNNFDIITHSNKIPDKRRKEGFREEISYTYTYWGKEYTLKELNKKGVYITIEIHFDTLLDLIPYYPYIVTAEFYDKEQDKRVVYISNESFVETEHKRALNAGYENNMYEYYKKELQEHYIDVVKNYYFYNIDSRTKYASIYDFAFGVCKLIKLDNGNYGLETKYPIDSLHSPEYFDKGTGKKLDKSHWCSPKIYDENTIELSKEDVEEYLKDDLQDITIKYVAKCDFPLNLG